MAVVEVSNPSQGIALVTLNRPDKLNAMTSELVESLHDTFDTIADEASVRVVVLTGAGRGFCAGLAPSLVMVLNPTINYVLYEALVARAAATMNVVTAADLVALARSP